MTREIILTKKFRFEAAHNLTSYHGQCEKLHGHSYVLEISVIGTPDKEGMVIDFAQLKQVVKDRIIDKLDHTYLNDVFPFNPTVENMLMWMADELAPLLKNETRRLQKITIWETENNKSEIVL